MSLQNKNVLWELWGKQFQSQMEMGHFCSQLINQK